jgi:hypothetical protein
MGPSAALWTVSWFPIALMMPTQWMTDERALDSVACPSTLS